MRGCEHKLRDLARALPRRPGRRTRLLIASRAATSSTTRASTCCSRRSPRSTQSRAARSCSTCSCPRAHAGLTPRDARRTARRSRAIARRDPRRLDAQPVRPRARSDPERAARDSASTTRPSARVKVIHVPIYLHERDGLLDLPYEAVLRAVDVTVLPVVLRALGLHARGEPRARRADDHDATSPASAPGCESRASAERRRSVRDRPRQPRRRRGRRRPGRPARASSRPRRRTATRSRALPRERRSQLQWSRLAPRFLEAFEVARDEAATRVEPRRPRARPLGGAAGRAATRPGRPQATHLRRRGRRCRRRSRAWSDSRATIGGPGTPRPGGCSRSSRRERWEAAGAQPDPLPARHLPGPRRAARATRLTSTAASSARCERCEAYLERPVDGVSARGARSRARRRSPTSAPSSASHESLHIYSGGLGVLAGDHLKAASDLGLPLVASGSSTARATCSQRLDRRRRSDRARRSRTIRATCRSSWCATRNGEPLEITLPLPGGDARAARSGARRSAACRSTCSTPTSRRTGPRTAPSRATSTAATTRCGMRQEIVLGRGGVAPARRARHRARGAPHQRGPRGVPRARARRRAWCAQRA